jgi:hypothetical protein
MEINTQIRGVLAHRADLNLGSGLVPPRERVDIPWVSLLGLALSYLCQSLFLNVCIPVQGLVHAHSTPRGVSLPEDVVRQEARRGCSELLWAWGQRRWLAGNMELTRA